MCIVIAIRNLVPALSFHPGQILVIEVVHRKRQTDSFVKGSSFFHPLVPYHFVRSSVEYLT
jgi:hypothetical protein